MFQRWIILEEAQPTVVHVRTVSAHAKYID